MGWLHGVERKLENVVNNVFARAFRSEVEPIEIATRLTKELDSQAKLLNRDKRLVPNNFTVYLSTHDYDELAPMARAGLSRPLPATTTVAAAVRPPAPCGSRSGAGAVLLRSDIQPPAGPLPRPASTEGKAGWP